jgi:hypothetical protein
MKAPTNRRRIGIQLTDDEKRRLAAIARAAGMRPGAFIRAELIRRLLSGQVAIGKRDER